MYSFFVKDKGRALLCFCPSSVNRIRTCRRPRSVTWHPICPFEQFHQSHKFEPCDYKPTHPNLWRYRVRMGPWDIAATSQPPLQMIRDRVSIFLCPFAEEIVYSEGIVESIWTVLICCIREEEWILVDVSMRVVCWWTSGTKYTRRMSRESGGSDSGL